MFNSEEVIEDAEIAALFFRSLVSNGMTVMIATQVTAAHTSARQITRASAQKPRDPWEKDPLDPLA